MTLPSGTVTFLFTDIEGSTKLAQQYPGQWEALRARHHEILQSTMETHHGYVFQIIGDAFCVAFHSASQGLLAAIDSQRKLQAEAWGEAPIRVRIGIHAGEAELRENEYRGYLTLARVQRVMSAAYGEQVLLSNTAAELIRGQLPEGVTLRDMKENLFKGWSASEHLWQVVAPDLRHDFPALSTLNIIPNNLPVPVTSFVGREGEIAEVKRFLEKSRLVTLTGSGGTGKTRLSLQAAAEILDRFKDGVWLIELAPITDPELVPKTVASILGIREEPARPILTTLLDWFSDRKLLLVLDNCEHLLEACARFTDSVLRGSREVRILASSREALGIAGEMAYRVPSLPTPNPRERLEMERLEKYESVQLFVERARQTVSTFQVTHSSSPAITQICHRLDGIPLAIELAAARVKVLSLEQIAERLDDRFRLLTGGSRTALPRQQTLRALIDWSYQLLSEQERLLFRRLAVFVGGWTLEAAEAVCSGEGIEAVDVLDLLIHLVDKSLVIVDNAGKGSRYRRLETIRQYAREKLFETEEAAQIRDRHLDYFRAFAEEAEVEIVSSNQLVWLGRLHDEFDNLRAALEWSREKRAEDGLRLGSAIWRFCLRYGYTNEIVEKLNQLLQQPQETIRTQVRAKTLCALSLLAGLGQGDRIRHRTWAETSLALYKELEDQHGEAASLYSVALVAFFRDASKALSLFLQSLTFYRALNDKTGISEVLIMIGLASGDPTQRQACLEEALALARERGNLITMAGALDHLGRIAMYSGNFSQARKRLEESLEIQLPLGAPGYISTLQHLSQLEMHEGKLAEARAYWDEVNAMAKQYGLTMTVPYLWSLPNVGYIALQEGNLIQAKEMFSLAVQQFQKANNLIGTVYSIEGLASLHVKQARPERACRLFAWADAVREKINDRRPAVEQASVERDLAVIHSKLDEVDLAKLYTEGSVLTMEQAIALALEEV